MSELENLYSKIKFAKRPSAVERRLREMMIDSPVLLATVRAAIHAARREKFESRLRRHMEDRGFVRVECGHGRRGGWVPEYEAFDCGEIMLCRECRDSLVADHYAADRKAQEGER